MAESSPSTPMSRLPRFRFLIEHRLGGAVLFVALYLGVATLTRLALALKSLSGLSYNLTLPAAFVSGFGFDLAMALFFAAPVVIALVLTPRAIFGLKAFRAASHLFFTGALAVFLFGAVSEWLFWDEFGVRFNFIAVDYLIYTTEVIRNIRESYNMPVIFGGIAALASGGWWLVTRTGVHAAWLDAAKSETGYAARFKASAWLLGPVVAAGVITCGKGLSETKSGTGGAVEVMSAGIRHMGGVQPTFANAYNTELSHNGHYAFLSAFWTNQLDYRTFYPVRDTDATFRRLRAMLKQDNVSFASGDDKPRDITRVIRGKGPEKRLNVIQITIESLSAEHLGCYGDKSYAPMNLTPNIDNLAMRSLWFRHAMANGTRTVRGMEALTLAVPPTPGQAILRRPRCENLATMGAVFKNRGYDTAFIYGGDGLFDNMNYFFAHNGYRVLDRPARFREHPETKPVFENAWGVCDEDLYDWVIDEADRSHSGGKPFHHFVMTTSNHRPFTWPAGRINRALTGREGGVAYTDYALGRFLKKAESKAWFKNTVFVIVADHCASVAGKRELEVRKYEIPMFVYAPGIVEPCELKALCSQVDLPSTVFGILDFSYVSRFFGRDMLRARPGQDRAFVSNYQKLGLIQDGELAVLKPVRDAAEFSCDMRTGELTKVEPDDEIEDAIAWYQCAADLFNEGKLAAPSRAEENALLAQPH